MQFSDSCVASLPRYRKKAVEMELAKCKIDIMSLNSQLLDAIQQKLNLSQQLEAWQVSLTHSNQSHYRMSLILQTNAKIKPVGNTNYSSHEEI